MLREDYDTVAGIMRNIGSLEQLNTILNERHEAGYGRKERLDEFLLLGTWILDSCGNAMKAMDGRHDVLPKEALSGHIPTVMRMSEFRSRMEHAGKGDAWCSYKAGSDIPPSGVVCPICECGWTVADCHDVKVTSSTENMDLRHLVGVPLAEVQENTLNRVWNRVERLTYEVSLRNDKYIDLSPHERYEGDVKNQNGWIRLKDTVGLDHVVEKGDEVHLNTWTYYHSWCDKQRRFDEGKEFFSEVLKEAGFTDAQMHPADNPYCDCCWPAFAIWTEWGVLKIWYRKSVIEIDVAGLNDEFPALKDLFESEDVTKGSDFIHAHGKEKAVEYLRKILDTLKTP